MSLHQLFTDLFFHLEFRGIQRYPSDVLPKVSIRFYMNTWFLRLVTIFLNFSCFEPRVILKFFLGTKSVARPENFRLMFLKKVRVSFVRRLSFFEFLTGDIC